MKWFKFYGQDFIGDPKMGVLTPPQRLLWVYLLSLASQSDKKDGLLKYITLDHLRMLAGITPEYEDYKLTEKTLEIFEKLELIEYRNDFTLVIKNYKQYQDVALTNAERQAKFREKRRESNEEVTGRNKTVTLEKSREEKNKENYVKEIAANAAEDINKKRKALRDQLRVAVLAVCLFVTSLLYPVKTYAKTLKLTLTVKAGLVGQHKPPFYPNIRQPRTQLAKNTKPDATSLAVVNDYTPDDYQYVREKAVAVSEQVFGKEHTQSFVSLINGESHFNPYAGNPTSGACGIGQAYPCDKLLNICGSLDNIDCQVTWVVDYIARRYGNPTKAYEHWLSQVPINGQNVGHWY